MSKFKREILDSKNLQPTVEILQASLSNLIDLALQGKQAHWNLTGPNFRSLHLHLDEIIDEARLASDEVAERIVALGISADGRAAKVAEESRLQAFPDGFQTVEATISVYADRMATVITGLRRGIESLGELDPISEDMLIGISGGLEKQMWMLQAQEVR